MPNYEKFSAVGSKVVIIVKLSGPSHQYWLPLTVGFRERDSRYIISLLISIFSVNCFSLITDASIDLVRTFPLRMKKEKDKKK